MSEVTFYSMFLNIHLSGVLTVLAGETVAVSVCSAYTVQPCSDAPCHCHFMQSHICKMHACLAVTCHLHFWQNDQDLLHTAVVTQGWNGYRNKSWHRKLTLEKKILLLFLQGFEPMTYTHESGALTTELSPLPISRLRVCVVFVLWRVGWNRA